MTGERPERRAASTGPDDDVVPHPFGPGRSGERSADPEAAGETARVTPAAEPDAEPVAPEQAAEPDADADPAEQADADRADQVDADRVEQADADRAEQADGGPAEQADAAPTEQPAGGQPGESVRTDEPAEAPAGEPDRPAASVTARRRRDPLAAALIGVLTLLLGFAFAVQVRNVGDDQLLAGAREEDLVRILDDLNAREERLREQISEQRTALGQLTSSDSQSATALEEARERAEAIGILNGTVAAQGPGLTMIVRDPDDAVRVADVLDAIQELRGAGAETMQIDDVRIGVSSAVTGNPGGLMIDGRPIIAPYEFVVIGSPQNMETALNIPGGVVPRFTSRGASVTITQSEEVVVDALRPLDTPQYASPDTGD
jgi:uncharacterized protein YlxW (UPF0749 family)